MNNNNDNILRKINLPNIIGLGGLKGSGKDTCAEYFVKKGYTNLKFADALKNMLRSLFRDCGYTQAEIEDMLEGSKKDNKLSDLGQKTPRKLMQSLGTEWGRDTISSSLWTDIIRGKLRKHEKAIITDVRFINEANVVKSFGGCLIKIERTSLITLDDHSSEGYLDEIIFDDVVTNDSTIETLQITTQNCCSNFQQMQGTL